MDSLIDKYAIGGDIEPISPTTCFVCREKPLCGKPPQYQYALRVFEECDEDDQPNGRFIVLCKQCSELHELDDHPRLYTERYHTSGDICPGAMPQCETCGFRKGLSCEHPKRWSHGLVFGSATTSFDAGRAWSPNKIGLNAETPVDFANCQSRLGIVREEAGNEA